MKVFISWSGKTSGELAKILRDWLPSVIQAVKPYYSPDDITKGTRGNTINAKELEEAGVGLLCLTRENLEAPWIMFEAGALSKKLDKSRVCPILFGSLETTDLKGPFVQFQAAKFNKEEVWKMLTMVNKELGDDALETKVLDSVFEKWWPDLEQKVQALLEKTPKLPSKSVRKDRELLEEILTLTRGMSPHVRSVAKHIEQVPPGREKEGPVITRSTCDHLIFEAYKTGVPEDEIYSLFKAAGVSDGYIKKTLDKVHKESATDLPF